MRKAGMPVSPLLIAYILIPILEHNFRQALLISGGSLRIFTDRPIAATLIAFTLAWVAWRVFGVLRSARAGQR
jgi:putative tricarboxylic transport membrane protein